MASVNNQVLELLKDDNQYYSGIGKNYLSNSDIGTLLENPKEFGKQREDNKAFAEGRYFHQSILEPEKVKDVKFVDVSTRTTKEYKAFCEEHKLPFCLLKKEIDEVKGLVKIINSNIFFFEEIYKDGNQFEVPAVGEIQGMMWKGKADILNHDEGLIVDLKTTSNITDFAYSAKKYNYDSQAYIYKKLFGYDMIFMAIDKGTHQIGIFDCSDKFLQNGEDKVMRAVEAYDLFYKTEDFDPQQHLVTRTL